MPYSSRRTLSASTLAGTSVRNSKGDDLGSIKEVMIDLPSGCIAYCVLSFGGFLGMGDKLFAIPFSAFKLDRKNEELLLDVEKKTLETAPGFDKNAWPDFADQSYVTKVHKHYQVTPHWERYEATVTSR